MILNNISLKNYRNISEISFSADKGMNVFCADNAQGKTNILEAIWLLTAAKSFRKGKDINFIQFGKEKSVIFAEFESEQIKNDIKIEISDKKSIFINEKRVNSIAEAAGKFRAIIFSPADLSIVENGPSNRRKFLDTAIGQLYPSYISILKSYNKALLQRNSVIKEYKYDSSLSIVLDAFEEELAKAGSKIILLRERFLENLKEFLKSIYNELSSGNEELSAEYIYSFKGEDLKEALKNERKEASISGATSIGPHRDDIEFKINGVLARGFASQGQKRSIAIALKLSEAEVINKISGEYPVCLLDDIMSELDNKRQEYILNHIKGKQVFLSCCDASNIKNLKEGKIFKIKNGEILEECLFT